MKRGETGSVSLRSTSQHIFCVCLIIVSLLRFTVLGAAALEAVVSVKIEEKADSILKLYPEPFFPGGRYEPAIPDPDTFLGYPLGSRPAHYREVVDYLKALASFSPRTELHQYGETFEGRALYYLIISSVDNVGRMEEIKSSLELLGDPRKATTEKEVFSLIEKTPAVAWLGYGIHGDELSGGDAAIQVAYQLVAGTDPLTERLRQELVVIIDPLQNPDGRERYLAQLEANQGRLLNDDPQSLQHGGFWPWGRGNHYLFDLNRDWFLLVQPETRGKVRAVLEWNPQLLVDAHEMGPEQSFLFSPPNEPYNPNLTETIKKWWRLFSRDQAKAFDRYGWSYYTREWYEGWYPGYGSEWIAFLGAVAILYEQAGVAPCMVKQPDGLILTYREAAHHHFGASISNLTTAAEHRKELLRDFYHQRKEAAKNTGAFVIVPGENGGRSRRLIETLLQQKIEVGVATRDFEAKDLKDSWGQSFKSQRFSAGTYLVHLNQPAALLIKAIMEFDPRMKTSFLETERHHLEKFKESKLYEVTSWSLPLAYNLETYFTEERFNAETRPVTEIPASEGTLVHSEARYGYVFSCSDDNSLKALVTFLREDYKVLACEKGFRVEGLEFPRGSFLLRKRGNAETLERFVAQVAEKTGIAIYGLNTALAEEGPDLGGTFFRLLRAPRVGLLGGQPLDFGSYGAIWYLMDQEYEIPFSCLDVNGLERVDLDRYNVLVLPQVWGDPKSYRRVLGNQGLSKIKQWVEGGGTLLAIGSAAAFAADTSANLSRVRLYRQSLEELGQFREALSLERLAEKPVVDSTAVWGAPAKREARSSKKTEPEPAQLSRGDLEKLKAEDERARLFMPRGAILRADLDNEHWLTSGLGDKAPVILYTDFAFLSRSPIETVARLSRADNLRLSGLLWPEARKRWEETAYLTREGVGKGQIILFGGEPYFRGYFHGSGRLLVNAILLGPGLGTKKTEP